ncbi:MAG: metallophosphoesterase [Rhizobacter sp.]|nr:metallophosphoesterase [Rhizobacter sp.]
MKLALVTDLHANREAVSAVMAHARAQGAQRYAFLGDYVGYGADPGWVVDLVREHVARGAIAVLGNHDEAVVIGPRPTMVPDACQVVEWTREQLNAEQLAFLAGRPMSATEGDCLFVHANAYAPADWDYIQGRTEAIRSLHATDQRFTFCGHVHDPVLFHLTATGKAGDFAPTPGVSIPLSPRRRWLAIPGSTGQPRDGNPAACYAMFDTASATLTFHRVAYDVDAAAAKVRAAGLPEALAQRLIHGS